jgi:predicted transglutaminase-like cysteine proteinase
MADYWQLPHQTEKRGKGDCEDKAIWLYSKLLKKGFKNVRLVIGKYRSSDIIFHAWVVWYHKSRIFILDPTHQGAIKELKNFSSDYYRPYYSYYHSVKWHHQM